jgi:hypothetical protein
MDHPVQKTNKQIYNQKYAELHPELMRFHAAVNYAQNREKILLRQAHNRYLKGVSLRKETVNKLVDAGYVIGKFNPHKYECIDERPQGPFF